ncbi:hypothetical protein KKH18_06690 [bacterium]|nr:hypothetical protein [bacterium]
MYCRLISSSVLFSALLFFVSCGTPPSLVDLWGVWQGTAAGQDVTVEFREDGKCVLEFRDIKTGESHRFRGEFQADFTKQPIPVSVRSIPELPHALHMIIAFGADGSLYMSQFSTQWRLRPIAFETDKTVKLTRVPQRQSDVIE